MDELIELQALLAQLMYAADPEAELATLQARADLSPATHEALSHIDKDGLRISALLVAKLRFERLMSASAPAINWFAKDPAAFAAAFKRYHTTHPATAQDPWLESKSFALWLADHTEPHQLPPLRLDVDQES